MAERGSPSAPKHPYQPGTHQTRHRSGHFKPVTVKKNYVWVKWIGINRNNTREHGGVGFHSAA
jgi:hypothetical protein